MTYNVVSLAVWYLVFDSQQNHFMSAIDYLPFHNILSCTVNAKHICWHDSDLTSQQFISDKWLKWHSLIQAENPKPKTRECVEPYNRTHVLNIIAIVTVQRLLCMQCYDVWSSLHHGDHSPWQNNADSVTELAISTTFDILHAKCACRNFVCTLWSECSPLLKCLKQRFLLTWNYGDMWYTELFHGRFL